MAQDSDNATDGVGMSGYDKHTDIDDLSNMLHPELVWTRKWVEERGVSAALNVLIAAQENRQVEELLQDVEIDME